MSTLTSLHKRILVLENRTGVGQSIGHSIGREMNHRYVPVVSDVENVLTTINNIQNYEKTIEAYSSRFETIKNMCLAPDPDWIGILVAIVDLLAQEDVVKSHKNDERIRILESNLAILEIMDQIATKEAGMRRELYVGPDGIVTLRTAVDTGVNLGTDATCLGVTAAFKTVVLAIGDVKKLMHTIRNYSRTIQEVRVKFDMIKKELESQQGGFNIGTIITAAMNIINIIKEEDMMKNSRESMIIEATEKTTLALEQTVKSINALMGAKLGSRCQAFVSGSVAHFGSLDVDQELRLGSLINLALSSFGAVIKGVEMVVKYQETIEQVVGKYDMIMGHMNTLIHVRDARDIVPCLLDMIAVIKEEDVSKLQRDRELVNSMEIQNQTISHLYNSMIRIGAVVLDEGDGKTYFT